MPTTAQQTTKACATEGSATEGSATEGYAAVNGLRMYWRSIGDGGTSLVVVHGGFGLADMFGDRLRDGGWDGAARPAGQLAILPGRTHYDVVEAPELPGVVDRFLE